MILWTHQRETTSLRHLTFVAHLFADNIFGKWPIIDIDGNIVLCPSIAAARHLAMLYGEHSVRRGLDPGSLRTLFDDPSAKLQQLTFG